MGSSARIRKKREGCYELGVYITEAIPQVIRDGHGILLYDGEVPSSGHITLKGQKIKPRFHLRVDVTLSPERVRKMVDHDQIEFLTEANTFQLK